MATKDTIVKKMSIDILREFRSRIPVGLKQLRQVHSANSEASRTQFPI